MTTPTKPREWKTDDLRQVIGPNGGVVSVQRRWLVATGETYGGETPRSGDHRDIADYPPPGLTVYVPPLWAVTRSEWRDLPRVVAPPS